MYIVLDISLKVHLYACFMLHSLVYSIRGSMEILNFLDMLDFNIHIDCIKGKGLIKEIKIQVDVVTPWN